MDSCFTLKLLFFVRYSLCIYVHIIVLICLLLLLLLMLLLGYSTINSIQEAGLMHNAIYKQYEAELFKDPLLKGILPANEFEAITDTGLSDKDVLRIQAAENKEDDIDSEMVDTNQLISLQKELFDPEIGAARDMSNGMLKLLVCQKFLHGECTKTTCQFAHPGLRDDARISKARVPGSMKKVPYVKICSHYNGICLDCKYGPTNSCPYYHVYVRPSTRDIILRLYPLQSGIKAKLYSSGAKFEGHVKRNVIQGYGVLHWANDSVYIGDFENNLRHGIGIFRSKQYEYVGSWVNGIKEGWGVCVTANDEEYAGKMMMTVLA